MITILLVFFTSTASFIVGWFYGGRTSFNLYHQGWEDCKDFHEFNVTLNEAAGAIKEYRNDEWNFDKHRTN